MLTLQASFRQGFRGPGSVLALQASFRQGFRGLGYGSFLLLYVCFEVFHSSVSYAFLFHLLGCVEGVLLFLRKTALSVCTSYDEGVLAVPTTMASLPHALPFLS